MSIVADRPYSFVSAPAADSSRRFDSPDLTILALFRVCFSLVGIGYLSSYLRQIDLSLVSSVVERPLLEAACVVAIVMLVLQLIGWGGRAVTVLHFLAVAAFLPRTFPTASVNEQLYLLVAFWSCFMRLDGRFALMINRRPASAWPLYMLGINIGVFLLSAGMFKLSDSRWMHGTYVSVLFRAPECCLKELYWLSNVRIFPQVVNYSVILFELLWLPLFLAPRYRHISLLALFAFFCGMILPLRLDWIGEVGCCMSLALMAVSPTAASLVHGWVDRLAAKAQARSSKSLDAEAEKIGATPQKTGGLPSAVNRMLCALLALLLCVGTLKSLVSSPWRIVRANPIDSFRERNLVPIVDSLPTWLQFINTHTICLGPKNMFTIDQAKSVGELYLYRIEVLTTDGQQRVPLKSFNLDGTAGTDLSTPGRIRVVVHIQKPISTLMHKLRAHDKPSTQDRSDVSLIMQWAAEKVGAPTTCVRLYGTRAVQLLQNHKLEWQEYCQWTPEQGLRMVYDERSNIKS